MNIYESDYWKLTVFLQKRVGLWPFQKSPWKNYVAWIYVYSCTISFMVGLGMRWYIELSVNIEIVMENTIGELYLVAVMSKITYSILYRSKLKCLYEQVANDWRVIKDAEELKIMHKYTAVGSKIVRFYSGYLVSMALIFMSMPSVTTLLLNVIMPQENSTRRKELPYYGEYGFEIEKYYYPMTIHAIVGGLGTMATTVTFDIGFMLMVQHVLALCNLVNLRLSEVTEIAAAMEKDSKNIGKKDCIARRYIIQAINRHQTVMNYVDIIEDCYCLPWLIVLLVNMVALGAGMSTYLTKLNRPVEAIRYGICFCGGLVHFYYIFLPGQKMIDSSEAVFDYCYACNWHNLSEKSKTLLKIMMTRSSIRCELTGGKMFILCMETYCKMMKTGYTFFNVINLHSTIS